MGNTPEGQVPLEVTRRNFILFVAGTAGALVVGCGPEEGGTQQAVQDTATPPIYTDSSCCYSYSTRRYCDGCSKHSRS
ncbi:MAG TPA: twin-arginine translocation signal domain-containing protein [bacterium]|nr:twin-arginine translocation signal domain-containing protein [bacterium]